MSASKVIEIAKAEVGYLEKASNSQLNDKTANAGYNNWTKYGAWYNGGSLNGQPWCDMFVSWCANQAGEISAVGKYAYVPSHVNFFKNKGTFFYKGAKTHIPGDVIFFRDQSHVGLVEYVSGGYVHTIEGNTSAGSTLIANGGGVHQKTYPIDSSYIYGYGRPAYGESSSTESGWKQNDTGWWYCNADGTWPASQWMKINDVWYYFNAEGYMVHDTTLTIEGKTYQFDSNGHYTEISNNNSEKLWGVDVSTWQGNINWTKVANSGCKFAILRGGYRYSVDDTFATNATNAIAAGIPIGVYWFSYATTTAEAKSEAEYCVKTIKNYNITLPVFFDWEYDSYNKALAKGVTVTKTLFNDMAVAFCKVIAAAGYKAGVYYNLDYYNKFIDSSRLGSYYQWYAQYASSASYSNYTLWQYSSSESVNGISGNVDMNILKDTSLLTEGSTDKWVQDDKGWWYRFADGTWPATKWLKINDVWYYFKADGYMAANEVLVIDNKIYQFDNNGHYTEIEEDDENMTQEKFNEMMDSYLKTLAQKDGSAWSKEHRDWAEDQGLVVGDEHGNKMYKKFMTREEMITVFHRFAQKHGME